MNLDHNIVDMRPISPRVRKILEEDPRMEKCEICGARNVEWAHIFQYANRQIDEAWNIIALCKTDHDLSTPHKNGYDKRMRYRTELIALGLMGEDDEKKYPKVDWQQKAREALFELSMYVE